MIFKRIDKNHLNESFDDTLEEKLLIEGPRGQTELRAFICDQLNAVCGTALSHGKYQIHHKDFYHDNYHPDNLVLLPTNAVNAVYKISPNSSIHANIKPSRTGSQALSAFSTADITKYINIITQYDCIDYSRSLSSGSIHILSRADLGADIARARRHPLGMIR